MLRTATPTAAFWQKWRDSKDELKAAGISLSKNRDDEWEVCEWTPIEPEAAEPLDITPLDDDRLLEWQRPHAGALLYGLGAFGSALDGSDTGTGKTYSACAVAAALGVPMYVVAPKAVLPIWRRLMIRFGVKGEAINYEMVRTGKLPALRRGNKRFEWTLDDRTLLVFDECHRCKNAKSLNAKMALAALKQGYRVLALSATPADNPLNMKFVCAVTGLASEREYWSWCRANGVGEGRWGMEFLGGPAVLARIHRQIFDTGRGSRIRIADLGDAFPETQIVAESYDLGCAPEVQRVYDECAGRIAELRRLKSKAANILAEQTRARQEVELLKSGGIARMTEDALADGLSVAIFVNYTESLQRLMDLLNCSALIHGGQTAEERQRAIDAFQADREHVIICNIMAGGVGVSLHGKAEGRQRLALIAPTWSAQDLKQALGRVHRAGGGRSLQRIVFCAETIEEQVCERVAAKLKRIEALTDGDCTPGPFSGVLAGV